MAVKTRQVKHSAANGYMKAVNSSLDFEMDETLRDFRSLNTPEARGAFADKWLHLASSTLNRTWPMVYELLRIIRDDQIYLKGDWLETREAYADFSGYFESVIGQPFDTWAELEETYHFVEAYKPELFKGSYAEAKRTRAQMAAENTTGEANKRGGDRKSKSHSDFDTVNERAEKSGVHRTTQMKLDRLARERPDLKDLVAQGVFSVEAAMREAGFVKQKTPLEHLRYWWKKASEEERRDFLGSI